MSALHVDMQWIVLHMMRTHLMKRNNFAIHRIPWKRHVATPNRVAISAIFRHPLLDPSIATKMVIRAPEIQVHY